MVFTDCAVLEGEHLILSNMPEFCSLSELESAFRLALKRGDRCGFNRFCRSAVSSNIAENFRLYRLIGFYPYRFALAEKCIINGGIKTLVFISERIAELHALMVPTSNNLRDIAGEAVHGIESNHKNDMLYITAEAFSTLNHMPCFSESLLNEVKQTAYCDLGKVLEKTCKAFAKKPAYADVKFERISTAHREHCIVELPLEALVYTLVSVFALLNAISYDGVITASAYSFAYAGEITLSICSPHTANLPSESSNLAELVAGFPSLCRIAQCATLISYISSLIIYTAVDKENERITVNIGVGFDLQSEPDFKFSDPYSQIEKIANDALDTIERITKIAQI